MGFSKSGRGSKGQSSGGWGSGYQSKGGSDGWSAGAKGWSADPYAGAPEDDWSGAAWGGAAGGKGKAWASDAKAKGKGKGKDKDATGEMDPASFTYRIKTQYQVSKQLLRASMDADGGAFVKSEWARQDADVLAFDNFAALLSTDNSHLLRRPGVGLSEVAASIRHGVEVLQIMNADIASVGIPATLDALEPSVLEALGVIDTKGPEGERSQRTLQAALKKFFTFLNENGELYDKVKDSAIAGARVYLASISLLQAFVVAADAEVWADVVPDSGSDATEVSAWRTDATNKRKMYAALAKMMLEKKEEEEQWKKGGKGGAIATFGQRSKQGGPERKKQGAGKAKKKDSSSDESDAASKEKKTKKEKKEGKGKKTKKKQSSASSNSDSAASEKKKKKEDSGKKTGKREASDDSGDSAKRLRGLERAREAALTSAAASSGAEEAKDAAEE